MGSYVITKEERKYLSSYDISRFERPSVAADMAVFSIMGTEAADEAEENYRKDPEKRLKLLLIRRGSFPYKDYWALPGGFCRPGERVEDTARRELLEETGVGEAYLEPFDIFSDPGRDPRGWMISHAFLALIDGERYQVRGGSDAWEAGWFGISLEKKQVKKEVQEASAEVENVYELQLVKEGEVPVKLRAVIRERKYFHAYHERVDYEILETEGLAFDHARIILCAYLALQRAAGDTGRIVFDLMPELFTLASLQKAYETIQGKALLTPNFRRKIAGYVTETEHVFDGAGHRPAKLYRRNLEAFYRE
ncbi:MAG: NUDIX hydrolase [Lachnospiraceae bacterium]|nr:NUDIX hydrolase [Lachnospiraceae bacterium]